MDFFWIFFETPLPPSLTLVEWAGIVFSLLYVTLVSRQIIWCWPSNLLGATLYAIVFYNSELYLFSLLQLYYFGISIYGWISWVRKTPTEDTKAIKQLPLLQFLALIGTVLALSCVSLAVAIGVMDMSVDWVIIGEHFSTWIAVFAMVLAAKKFIENWLLWICGNIVYIAIFLESELYGTAALNTVFLALSFYGFWQWKKNLQPLTPKN